jgi:hypothetical protein
MRFVFAHSFIFQMVGTRVVWDGNIVLGFQGGFQHHMSHRGCQQETGRISKGP